MKPNNMLRLVEILQDEFEDILVVDDARPSELLIWEAMYILKVACLIHRGNGNTTNVVPLETSVLMRLYNKLDAASKKATG